MNAKIKDLGELEFISAVMTSNPEFASKVEESGIDADSIIKKTKPAVDKYGVSTGVAFTIARLKEAILEANSDSVKGMIVGERDRFGTNSPVRVPLLSSKGDHMEVVNWGTSVKYGDQKIALPFPAVATLKIVSEGEYKGIPQHKLVAVESYDELSVGDAIGRLSKIAKTVGQIDGGDELQVVVVKGKISFIAAQTKWKDKEKDGSWQVYLPNQRDSPQMHPVMQITLESENGNQVRAVFDRQRNVIPTILVEDFCEVCADAVVQNSDPGEQAKFVGNIMKGREVIVVGFCTKFNAQAQVNYVELGAYAIFDSTSESVQSTLEKSPAATSPKKEVTKETAKEKKVEKPVEKPVETAKPVKKDTKAKVSPVDALKAKVRTYCELYGVSMNDVTAEKIIEAFKLDGVMSPGSVETVIDELRKE